MSRTLRSACSLLVAIASLGLIHAQAPAPDGLVSPEVRPDRTVTFRVRAPKAAQVNLYGDWMPVGKPEPMTKDADGVWSATAGPLDPTGHLYWFILDGLPIADPVNPRIKMRQRTSASLVEVPGNRLPWEIRDVPHGTVAVEYAHSPVLNRTERTVVYTPPGYDKGATRYPVLYLLHGSGDVPDSWTQAGNANFILDNLIGAGQARPMIVVMPAGHAVPFGQAPGARPSNTEVFEQYLVKDVMPLVEAKYRIAPGRENRAIAGLSMGGGQTLAVGFSHLDLFSAMGIFSAGNPAMVEPRFQKLLSDPTSTNSRLKLLWIACGDQDTTVQYPRVKQMVELLDKAGVRNTFRTYQGGAHTWPVWRLCLSEFAPLLFQAGSPKR